MGVCATAFAEMYIGGSALGRPSCLDELCRDDSRPDVVAVVRFIRRREMMASPSERWKNDDRSVVPCALCVVGREELAFQVATAPGGMLPQRMSRAFQQTHPD
jgi:hypothetical protein